MSGGPSPDDGKPSPLRSFASLITRHRAATLAALAAVILAAVGVIAVRGIPVDFTPQALFTTFETQQAIDRRFTDQFGSTENIAMVIVRADDVTTLDVLRYVHALGDALERAEAVPSGIPDAAPERFAERVESITRSALPRAGAPGELWVDSPVRGDTVEADEAAELADGLAKSGLFDGTLLSDDRDTTLVAVFLADGYAQMNRLAPAVEVMDQLLLDLPPPDGVTVELGGLPRIRAYMVERFIKDQGRLIPLAMAVCMFMLFLTFRWLPAVVLPAVAVGLTGILVLGGMALAQEPFNIINQIVPTLIIVIGISDSIHLVSRYSEESRSKGDRLVAARKTLVAMAAACFLTSFTTAVGFGSLVVSRTEILARFGLTAAAAVMLAYVVTVLFLPTTLPSARLPEHMTREQPGRIEAGTEWVVAHVLRWPRAVVVAFIALCGGLVALGAQVTIDTTLLEGFPESDPIHAQTRMIEDELNGVLPVEVSLISQTPGRFDDPEVLNAVGRVQAWLEGEPSHVLSTRSYPDLLQEVWAAYTDDASKRDGEFRSRAQVAQLASLLEGAEPDPLSPYVSSDRTQLRLNIQVGDAGSVATLALADRLQDKLAEELGEIDDLTVELTGDAYSGSLGLDSLIRDMSNSLGLAFVIIFGIMSVLFRSLRIGLISVPANVFPLLLTLAYMAVTGIALNTTTVIIFSISIGLAVDDTIHVLARYREERTEGVGVDEALLASARGSGRAIVVTSLMLGAGMLVMLFSSFMPVRLFGELLCVTLVGCILGDLLLLPAMLKLFAKR